VRETESLKILTFITWILFRASRALSDLNLWIQRRSTDNAQFNVCWLSHCEFSRNGLSQDCRPRNSQPHCQRSSFAYTAKPNLNNHRPQRIGLPGQRRTPTPLMEPVPPFRGIRKVTDSQRESTEISRTFCILWSVAVPLRHLITTADGDPNTSVLRNPRPFHRFHARRNCLDLSSGSLIHSIWKPRNFWIESAYVFNSVSCVAGNNR